MPIAFRNLQEQVCVLQEKPEQVNCFPLAFVGNITPSAIRNHEHLLDFKRPFAFA